MARRRPLSLQARSLLAASVALAAFLGLTGFALDEAIYNALRSSLQERLQTYLYGYLAASEMNRSGQLQPAEELPPDPRFNRPSSGLYAGVSGEKNSWRSRSAIGKNLPFDNVLPPSNEIKFSGPVDTGSGPIYLVSLGVNWEVPNRRNKVPLTFHVAEDASVLDAELSAFRRTLLVYLGGLGLLLLLLQLLVLRWSLLPLRRVSSDLTKVERGETERLSGRYPLELTGLTTSVNGLIESERDHLKRYRNTLSDLAHSLKTPLAVTRNQLESEPDGDALRGAMMEQVRRMDQIVAYQLSRAATSGQHTFATPVAIEQHAEEIVMSLEKVYATKNILCEFDIDAKARFYGEQGDLLELLGNLLENAFKWAKHRVLLTVKSIAATQAHRSGLLLCVEDDGPGIPPERIDYLLQRGVRGDERVQGHGIGLSIVQDILKAYRGELKVTQSEMLGGAAFQIRIDRT